MNKSLISLSFYLCIALKTNAEVFSSIYKMELLIDTQKNLIDSLENFIQSNRNHEKKIENYLRRLKIEHDTVLRDIQAYLGNPVNSFRLIKRLTIDVNLMEKLSSESLVLYKDYASTYPTEEDLLGAVEGLLRLETVYGLSKNYLANGIWNTSCSLEGRPIEEYFHPMTISDCYELGKTLYKTEYYKHGVEWLQIALNKKATQENQFPEDDGITVYAINFEISKGNKYVEKLRNKFTLWLHELSSLIPNINKLHPEVIIEIYKKGLQPSEAVKELKLEEYNTASLDGSKAPSFAYTDICKGHTKESESKKYHNNVCYFAQGPHPFLILAPFKAECLHRDPNIILFYDAINNAEIQTLYNITKPRLKRGHVGNTDNNGTVIKNLTKHRICQSASARSNDSLVVTRLKARISHITGMNLENSENLQIVNYGIGGYYAPHYDYWSRELSEKFGNRIATVVFYMSDVYQGGATAFPRLGLKVFPVKGAALFWNNLLPTGHGNSLSYHTACPVLRGSKWIATQWVNLRGQELTQPCPLM